MFSETGFMRHNIHKKYLSKATAKKSMRYNGAD